MSSTAIASTPEVPIAAGSKLARSTFWVSLASGVVAIVGFLREVVTARSFGAGYQMDVFLVVFTVMTFFPNLASQTLLGVFIPIFGKLRAKSMAIAWQLASSALNYIVASFLFLSAVLWFARRPVLAWAAPGFTATQYAASNPLFLIFVPVAVLWVVNEYLKAVLNCVARFFWPSLSQVWPGVGAIVGILLKGSEMNVAALAWGWLIGTGIQTITLLFQVGRTDAHYVPEWRPQPALKELISKCVPYFWVHFAITSLYFIDRHFASVLHPGSIAQLYFADRLLRLPIVLFTIPLFTAFHPHLSECWLTGGAEAVKSTASTAVRTAAAVTIPLAVIIGVLSRPLVATIYQGGSFSTTDVSATALVLQYFMPLIFLTTVFYILDRIFNVFGDPRTLMWTAFAMIATKWVLSDLLVRAFGLVGLPMATIAMHAVGVAILAILLRNKLGPTPLPKVWSSLAQITAASAIAGLAIVGCLYVPVFSQVTASKVWMFLQLGIASMVGCAVYLLCLVLVGSREVKILFNILKPSATTP
jgi:putative peptidoglycan lipid II flippase